MKKIVSICIALLSFGMLFAAAPVKGDTVYVAVRKAEIKEGTGNFDKVIKTLNYGDKLSVLGANTKWVLVSFDDSKKEGWIPLASVTTKKIVASANKGKVNASASEIALAGKGFSEEVETKYKTTSKLDYSAIDRLEVFSVKKADLKNFIEEGELLGAE